MAAEKRSYPRISDEAVSLRVKGEEFDAITHTLNISASGVYCKVDRELPLMSRVKLMLMIPEKSGSRDDAAKIDVTGVVVREHPVIVDGEIKHYDVAIFFDALTERDKETISQYVRAKLS